MNQTRTARSTRFYGKSSARPPRVASVIVVAETRGTSYKIYSVLLALGYLLMGARRMFFCDAVLYEGEASLSAMWANCKNDPYSAAYSGGFGLFYLGFALIRLYNALAASTSDYRYSAFLLTVMDICALSVFARFGYEAILVTPIHIKIMIALSVPLDIYSFWNAQKAFKERINAVNEQELYKSRRIVAETLGIPYRVGSGVFAFIYLMLFVRHSFFCGKPLYEGEAEKYLSVWGGCHENIAMKVNAGLFAIGLLIFGLVRLSVVFARRTADLYHRMILTALIDVAAVFVIHVVAGKNVPLIFSVSTPAAVIVQAFVLKKSRTAYLDRLKEKRN